MIGRIIPAVVVAFLGLASHVLSQDIIEATKLGDLDSVKTLIAQNQESVQATDSRNCQPLHFAADGGHFELVKFLLENGADIAATDVDGDTPLMWAVYSGYLETTKYLVSRGANLAVVNNNLRTPMHYAASGGSTELIEYLMAHGADINAADHGGNTPLHRAAMQNHPDAVRLLIEIGAQTEAKDNYGRTPLLLVARERGDADMARLLLDLGADVNASDRWEATSLHLAAWRGFETLVNLLLDRGAALPESADRTNRMTMYAVERGLDRLFEALAGSGADLTLDNENGGSLLNSACEGGSETIASALLNRGLEIDRQDRYGWTPLHCAAKKGRTQAAALLLEHGANLEIKTLSGYTPLQVARQFEREEPIQLLTEKGANTSSVQFVDLQGQYLGQAPPDTEPLLFAPDVVSSNRFEHGTVTFSLDGREAFWSSSFFLNDSGYTYGRILTSSLENGRWTDPTKAIFSGIQQGDDIPHFSFDGDRLYFGSSRPAPDGTAPGESIWYVERVDEGWAAPQMISGGPNSMGHHWQFSVAANCNIYFSSGDPGGFGDGDIYVSRFEEGAWQAPENLGAPVNSEHEEGSPFIAPDESYLIVTRGWHPDGYGDMDLAISFRRDDGGWTPPVHFPEPINTAAREMCPMVTADGKYLFFNSFRQGPADNFWVSANIIEQLRKQQR